MSVSLVGMMYVLWLVFIFIYTVHISAWWFWNLNWLPTLNYQTSTFGTTIKSPVGLQMIGNHVGAAQEQLCVYTRMYDEDVHVLSIRQHITCTASARGLIPGLLWESSVWLLFHWLISCRTHYFHTTPHPIIISIALPGEACVYPL